MYFAHVLGSGMPLQSNVVDVLVVAVVVSAHALHKVGHALVTSLPTNVSVQKCSPRSEHCSGSAAPLQSVATVVVDAVVVVTVGASVVGWLHVVHSTGHVDASGNGANDSGVAQKDSNVDVHMSGSVLPLHWRVVDVAVAVDVVVSVVTVVSVVVVDEECGQRSHRIKQLARTCAA